MRPIFIVTGGTGGHVFPSIALSEELHQRGIPVVFLCDKRGRKYFSKNTQPIKIIELFMSSPSSGILGKFMFLLSLVPASFQALVHTLINRPRAVVCFGGYSSFPGGLAAVLTCRKLFLHEQNASLGTVNRLFTHFASLLALSYSPTKGLSRVYNSRLKVLSTGVPIRKRICLIPELAVYPPQLTGERFFILVLGGSQGSRSLVKLVVNSLVYIPIDFQGQIYLAIQSHEKEYKEKIQRIFKGNIYIKPFFDDIHDFLKQANLVISRCGASTLAELAASSRPSVIVPYPYAKGNHQVENARVHISNGGGWILHEGRQAPSKLGKIITYLMRHPSALLYASEQIARFSFMDASKILAQLVIENLV